MKGFERMRDMKINHGLYRLASLTLAMLGMVWAANAATGTSSKFAIDLTGMGRKLPMSQPIFAILSALRFGKVAQEEEHEDEK